MCVIIFLHACVCVECVVNDISVHLCYEDISYHTPKMDSSNLNIFSEINSLWNDNFSYLKRHLTDGLQAEHGYYFLGASGGVMVSKLD